jgi:predicted metal-dependent enzyme (double-stranded beta helix superfamily)
MDLGFQQFTNEIDAIVQRERTLGIGAQLAERLGKLLPLPDLLEGRDLLANNRHLIYSPESKSFTVVAFTWRPGQTSPIHSHNTWCALAVMTGQLEETLYDPSVDAEGKACAVPRYRQLLTVGTVSHADGADGIHRLANSSDQLSVTLHVYGRDLSQGESSIGTVFLPQ